MFFITWSSSLNNKQYYIQNKSRSLIDSIKTKKENDLNITKADKGNTTVVSKRTDCI